MISFKDPKLAHSKSFGMIWEQSYRGSSFEIEWMRGTLICDNSLSPLEINNICIVCQSDPIPYSLVAITYWCSFLWSQVSCVDRILISWGEYLLKKYLMIIFWKHAICALLWLVVWPSKGPLHTWAKGRDHVITKAHDSHPKFVRWHGLP